MSDNIKSNGVLTMEQRVILSRLKERKLAGFAEELEEQFNNPLIYDNLTLEQKLDRCLNMQEKLDKEARFLSLFRSSRLHSRIYLENLRVEPERGLTKELLQKLNECTYIEENRNILITGFTGTGKTALATAAAMAAMSKGYSTLFYRLNDLTTILEGKDNPAFKRFKDRMKKIQLFIIDDYGTIKISDTFAVRLLDIAESRYNYGSTIITSQIKRENLKLCIEESPVRDSLSDRLFNASSLDVVLKGASWRGSDGEIRGENPNV